MFAAKYFLNILGKNNVLPCKINTCLVDKKPQYSDFLKKMTIHTTLSWV